MNFLEALQQKGFLGREFLTWLWFTSERQGGFIHYNYDKPPYRIAFLDRIVLSSDDESVSKQVVTLTGETFEPKHALAAILEGKKIEEARISVNRHDNDNFAMLLKATWFQFSGLRTPPILPAKEASDDEDDETATFLEKFALVTKAMDIVDSLFQEFLNLRLSERWASEELPLIQEWISQETE
jgi:recombination associated protein RdgC